MVITYAKHCLDIISVHSCPTLQDTGLIALVHRQREQMQNEGTGCGSAAAQKKKKMGVRFKWQSTFPAGTMGFHYKSGLVLRQMF